jgi:ATP-dependent Clp protease ATP-binding subunit ClpA
MASCPQLEHELEERAEPDGEPMVKEEVDDDDVAEVVARWTGIPSHGCSRARPRS